MTEEEWLSDERGLTPLERELVGTGTGLPLSFSTSVRKERLFAVTCSPSEFVQDERLHGAIGVVERYADGLATEDEVRKAWEAATGMPSGPQRDLAFAVLDLSERNHMGAARCSAERLEMAHLPGDPLRNVNLPAHWKIWRLQAHRLRDIFGNPFRPVSIDASWLTPTVTSLAQSAYEERIMPKGELDPDRLAVLSDALQEAGCDDADILNHLRSPGPHVWGCWAVDLLTGRS